MFGISNQGLPGSVGEKILNSAQKGDTFEKSFTIDVDTNWDIHHLDLVAFISNNSTNEILQAESEPAENTN